ncbi:nucleotidyl transferase AbiEii/AbiGii toxin family protein [Stigmatella ashevillensis]|uniref:nucleotidyl transferase AbiEii/AbiGii toxin family protein n=1 Tax=Stigmatella ashevillensis TaxID=2995309 RepID=UPI00358DC0FB
MAEEFFRLSVQDRQDALGVAAAQSARPVHLLEGEPCDVRQVFCDAAAFLPGLVFPTASPRVMHAERTFWEKATAIHVLCSGGKVRGERFSRHWYDLVQLDKTGYAESALADRSLALPLTTTRL